MLHLQSHTPGLGCFGKQTLRLVIQRVVLEAGQRSNKRGERILSRVAKEKKPEQFRRKEGPSKSEMQKETILKAREISIEHLRKVPGRFLAADKNLLQTFHRRINFQ